MKKYIAPEVEIKRFAVENIMTGSEVVTPANPQASVAEGDVTGLATTTVKYNELFGLN